MQREQYGFISGIHFSSWCQLSFLQKKRAIFNNKSVVSEKIWEIFKKMSDVSEKKSDVSEKKSVVSMD